MVTAFENDCDLIRTVDELGQAIYDQEGPSSLRGKLHRHLSSRLFR